MLHHDNAIFNIAKIARQAGELGLSNHTFV